MAEARAISAQELWQGRFEWRVETRPDTMSEHAAPFGVAHDTISARIHPAKATTSLGAACQALGVSLFENHPVTTLSDNAISGPWGTASADAVIVAAGVAGFEMIAPYTPLHPGSGVKGQAAVLGADMAGHPQIYADGVYIIPHADGAVAVGSTSEKTWTADGIDDQLDTVIAKAHAICPDFRKCHPFYSVGRASAQRRGGVIRCWAQFPPLRAFTLPLAHSRSALDFRIKSVKRLPAKFAMNPLTSLSVSRLIGTWLSSSCA